MNVVINDTLEHLIQSLGKDHDVNPAWMKAIVTQESQWNAHAIRYEVNFSYLYHPEKFTGPLISLSTEMATQKMSWGLCQVMGALAREQGHEGFMSELIKPEVNLLHLAKRLHTLKKYSDQVEDIFAGYNGGIGAMHKIGKIYSNQNYVSLALGYLQKFTS